MEDSNNLTVSHSHCGLFYTAAQEEEKGEDAIQVEGAPNETSSQLVEVAENLTDRGTAKTYFMTG